MPLVCIYLYSVYNRIGKGNPFSYAALIYGRKKYKTLKNRGDQRKIFSGKKDLFFRIFLLYSLVVYCIFPFKAQIHFLKKDLKWYRSLEKES